jgi:hypothetical protein
MASVCLSPSQAAWALIRGGEGNAPINDPGWPAGAAAVFNTVHRVAYWEGPPFGGGEWHSECRGDATAFNEILVAFEKLDAPKKRLVIHDGVGKSFWLNPNREEAKREAAAIDWVFVVWQPDSWKRLQKLPADLRPRGNKDDGPVPQIDLYAGGHVPFADVKIPKGIEVVDRRLEAHGFELTDGVVLEGTVRDLATQKPLAATVQLQRVEPQPKGGYQYVDVLKGKADETGRWVLKSVPAGWHRAVLEADGYVPRIIGYGQYDSEPQWIAYETGLSRATKISGRVTDDEGQPLADVQVRIGDVSAGNDDGRYDTPAGYEGKTNAEGRFDFDQLPSGQGTVWIHKPGYCRPGLGLPVELPAKDVALRMQKAAALKVTVDFEAVERPQGYIVNIEPEGGSVVGSWGGSGNINAENFIRFEQIPPGKYILFGRPNPGSEKQETDKMTVDLQGGKTAEIVLRAK